MFAFDGATVIAWVSACRPVLAGWGNVRPPSMERREHSGHAAPPRWTLLALVGSSAMARSKPHWPSQKPLLTGKPDPPGSQVAPPSSDLWTVPFASAVPAKTVTVAPTLLIASLLSVLMAVANVRVKVGDT